MLLSRPTGAVSLGLRGSLSRVTLRTAQREARTSAASITEVSVFLEEIAVLQTPKRLSALVRVLQQQGGKPVGPVDRAGLHPLLVPVATANAAEPDKITCLLRWPQPSKHQNMAMPVVTMQRGGRNMTLVARSVDEYLHRLLAEEDINNAGSDQPQSPLTEAAGADGALLYKPGDAAAKGFTGPKAQLYVVRSVGSFPDICERLSNNHLSKGDTVSALVASEWYMRNNFFPGWGRPYEFASELFNTLGKRDEEARDMARVALRLPWWTLAKPISQVQVVAQLEGKTPEEIKYALSEEAAAAAQAQSAGAARGMGGQTQPKSGQQLALERADTILDMVAAGALPDYDVVRPDLAEAYRAAGLNDVANFITAAS